MTGSRRARILLAVGAVAGIALAAAGALRPTTDRSVPRGAIARVNDRVITEERYSRSVEMLASDKRNALTDGDRAYVLRRLIEEELLIQRGVEIGLVDSGPSVRKSIAAAMIQSVISDAASLQPSRDEIETFYAENRDFFSVPSHFRVQEIFFRSTGENGDALARAQKAAAALEGEMPFEVVRERFGDRRLAELPDSLLPPQKLRQYLGPTLAQRAMSLVAGETTEPLRSPSGIHILRLVDMERADSAPLDAVVEQVEAEYRRRAADDALRGYLDRLVEEADLVLSETAPR
jgi:parvulin-like peptidyl-prolyl isomerase